MRKAYKYRLYPTKEQARLLDGTLELCRHLYNCGLEQRIRAYNQAGVRLSAYEQINELPELKEDFPEYKEIHSQVLQDVLRRLDKAFQNFLRRAKEGKEKPGFPRYKGQGRYDSSEGKGSDGAFGDVGTLVPANEPRSLGLRSGESSPVPLFPSGSKHGYENTVPTANY